MNKLILTALLVCSFQSHCGQPFITVGDDNDNDCDYHTIQSAIDSGDSDIIRIASNKNYFENLELSEKNRNLTGGYADCSMAELNITDLSQAILTGNGTDAVVRISNASGDPKTIVLSHIVVANGTSGVSVRSQNQGSITDVTLSNLRVFNNSGRGINITQIDNAAVELILNNSFVDFNSDGGVKCIGSNATMKVTGHSVIENNSTDANGGGVSASDGCDLAVYSPVIIRDNNAGSNGGGIHVVDGELEIVGFETGCSDGICFGQWDEPVTLENNVANTSDSSFGGGAVALLGDSSNGFIVNVLIKDNDAFLGGAVFVVGGALNLLGFETMNQPCWSKGSCSQITGNTATSGGAFNASNAAEIFVYHSFITESRADNGIVTSSSSGSLIEINTSVISKNGLNGDGSYDDQHLFYLFPGVDFPSSNLVFDYVTLANNQTSLSVIGNGNGDVDVTSSILFDEQDIYQESGSNPQSHFECVIASESSSFSAGGTVSVVDQDIEPVFVNPGAGNYHLLSDSPAIDYCYDASGNGGADIDYDDRAVDKPDVVNLHGVYDIGADEFNINNDIIFKNGFEDQG